MSEEIESRSPESVIDTKRDWTILSNHGKVLFHVATSPHATLREVSDTLGITERQVHRIIKDLSEGGLIEVHREGRRNSYVIHEEARLRHPMLSHVMVGRLLEVLAPPMSRMERAS